MSHPAALYTNEAVIAALILTAMSRTKYESNEVVPEIDTSRHSQEVDSPSTLGSETLANPDGNAAGGNDNQPSATRSEPKEEGANIPSSSKPARRRVRLSRLEAELHTSLNNVAIAAAKRNRRKPN